MVDVYFPGTVTSKETQGVRHRTPLPVVTTGAPKVTSRLPARTKVSSPRRPHTHVPSVCPSYTSDLGSSGRPPPSGLRTGTRE